MPRTTRRPTTTTSHYSPLVRVTAVLAVVAVVLTGVLTFVGLTSGDGGDDDADRDDTIDLRPATTTTLGPADLALAAELPDGPLAGHTRSPLGSGPLDLEGAAAEYPFGDPEGQRLRTHGFVRGVSRAWQNGEESLYLAVFELADPTGFLDAWRAVADPLADSRFDTPVGGGMVDVEGEGDQRSEASFVAWVDGTRWFYAVHFGPAGGAGPDVVRAAVDATTSR